MKIHILAEGRMELIVANRLLAYCGHTRGEVYGQSGSRYIKQKAANFISLASKNTGLFILTDFRDSGETCIPEALKTYGYTKDMILSRSYIFQFAVNEIESWLLADNTGIAKYFGINISQITLNPVDEKYPKQYLVNLARKSKKRAILEGIAPQQGHKSDVAPEYMIFMSEFVMKYWNIDNALLNAPSLRRCIKRLKELS